MRDRPNIAAPGQSSPEHANRGNDAKTKKFPGEKQWLELAASRREAISATNRETKWAGVRDRVAHARVRLSPPAKATLSESLFRGSLGANFRIQ